MCDPYKERVESDLSYSDKIIYGDLMRFTDELEQLAESESISTYPYGPYGPIDPNAPIPLIPNDLILESEAEQEALETWKLSPPPEATDEEAIQ